MTKERMAKKTKLHYLRVVEPRLKTKTFNSQKEYEAWRDKNKHNFKGDIKLGILRDKDHKVISITASYQLRNENEKSLSPPSKSTTIHLGRRC